MPIKKDDVSMHEILCIFINIVHSKISEYFFLKGLSMWSLIL